MAPQYDVHDRESQLPFGNESSARRQARPARRVRPRRLGRLDPLLVAGGVLLMLVLGFFFLGGGEEESSPPDSWAAGADAEDVLNETFVARGAGELMPSVVGTAEPVADPDVSEAGPPQGPAEASPSVEDEETLTVGETSAPSTGPTPERATAAPEATPLPPVASQPPAAADATAGSGGALQAEEAPAVALAPRPSLAPSARPDPSSGLRVQLYSMGTPEAAERAWEQLSASQGDLLAGLAPLVVRADLGDRTVYRLQAGPLADRAAAERLCGELVRRQVGCLVAPR